jgi:hypothetical protein
MPLSPAEQELAGFLKPAFNQEAFRVDRRRPFTFICGGNDQDGISALRQQFLAHLRASTSPILPVLAEKAFPHQLVERNLQEFESYLASAADCVLIFVESPGSFAETGLFAALKKVRKKTFIINTRDESMKDSFLNLGPIKLIHRKSNFDRVHCLDKKEVTLQDAKDIVQFILKNCTKYKHALVFQPKDKFTELEVRLQLACVHMAVTLLRAGTASLTTAILREHFGNVDSLTVERCLSLLTGIDALGRQDELYFNPNPQAFMDDALICSTNFSVDEVRAKTLGWQAKNNGQVAVFLREQRGIDI